MAYRASIPCLMLICSISATATALFLMYILVSDTGDLASFFEQLQQTSSGHEHRPSSIQSLGPYLRTINPPGVALEEDEQSAYGRSLLEEAHMFDNDGFIRLRNSDKKVNYYGVSMFHQLHCLKMLRDGLQGKATQRHSHISSAQKQRDVDDQIQPDHLMHCLDYISQAVVCAADDTIEEARLNKLPDGFHIAVIDGAETKHFCRDAHFIADIVKMTEINPIDIVQLSPGHTVSMLVDDHFHPN